MHRNVHVASTGDLTIPRRVPMAAVRASQQPGAVAQRQHAWVVAKLARWMDASPTALPVHEPAGTGRACRLMHGISAGRVASLPLYTLPVSLTRSMERTLSPRTSQRLSGTCDAALGRMGACTTPRRRRHTTTDSYPGKEIGMHPDLAASSLKRDSAQTRGAERRTGNPHVPTKTPLRRTARRDHRLARNIPA